MSSALLAAVVGGMFLLAPVAVVLVRTAGRNAGYPLAAAFAAAAAALASLGPQALDGGVTASVAWLPALGARLTLRLDGLSLLFALVICVIGSLVMAYTARYAKHGTRPGRLYGMLTLFAASMLGLVCAGDILLLFVCWELTSITSFFLIGGDGSRRAAQAATRALLVTALGGLALLAGLVLLAVTAGTFDLAEALSAPEVVRAAAAAPAIMALLLAGAFTKSALFPFHFWLPGAMIAPTPVSTYLHAATMVKAGLYLLARMSPVFAGEPFWMYTVTFVGLLTAVGGAALALAQYDLKALLAYSTVSQLGFIAALIGVGTPRAIAAASIHLVAHAAYKAALFMVVGIVDTEAGSRDIRHLSGLWRAMPLVASVTALSGLSMAGFPPLLGFVSKEEAFAAFIAAPGPGWVGPAAGALAVAASVMTFGYGARIFDGAFGGPLTQPLYPPRRSFVAPAMVCAVAGLAFGLTLQVFDPILSRIAADAFRTEVEVELALLHGFTPALLMSVVTMAGGAALFTVRRRVDRLTHRIRPPLRGTVVFDAAHDASVALGKAVGAPFTSRVPARHMLWVMGTAAAVGLGAWAAFGTPPELPAPPSQTEDWFVAVLLALAGLAIALSRVRLGAVAVLGIAGFVVAVLYVILGAPDLALTQLLVETLTVVLVVLVFRRLRPLFQPVPVWRRIAAATVAVTAGVIAGVGTYTLTGHRELSEAGAYFLEAAPAEAGGTNVVNTILVDFRALDTLGEITVLAIAAVGVFALVRARRMQDTAEGRETK